MIFVSWNTNYGNKIVLVFQKNVSYFFSQGILQLLSHFATDICILRITVLTKTIQVFIQVTMIVLKIQKKVLNGKLFFLQMSQVIFLLPL